MRGRARMPEACGEPGRLRQDVVAAIGDLAQLLNAFVQVAAFGGISHGGTVQSTVEQLVLVLILQRIECRFDYTRPSNHRAGRSSRRAPGIPEALSVPLEQATGRALPVSVPRAGTSYLRDQR